jgi:peptidoglycan/xylan/chitin deacetylase (PgdA/CDA1 family)
MAAAVERLTSYAARSAVFTRFVRLMEGLDRRRPGLLRVLTYHRIDDVEAHPELAPMSISASPQSFAAQIEYLASRYRPVGMAEVLAAMRERKELPPRSVLVTFDDGYRDFAEHAWPTLKRFGVAATLFVATSFPDDPERCFWWDRLHQALRATPRRDHLETPLGRLSLATSADRAAAAGRLIGYANRAPHATAMSLVDHVCRELHAPAAPGHVLNWDELRGLARQGVTLGAHTRTHPLLDRVPPQEAQREAAGSIADLRREIGQVLPVFAYPGGRFNAEIEQSLRDLDIALAFTTRRGINALRTADPLILRRINVSRHTTQIVLRAKLLPGLNRWRRRGW